jgi:hypothetical protein
MEGGDISIMNKRSFSIITGGMFLWTFFTGALWAGQVVTESHRNWAKVALVQEKTIGGADTPGTLAVLYFINHTEQPALDSLQKGLAFMLISDLSKVEGLKLVERVKLQALVEEIGLGKAGLVDPETAPRVGRLLRSAHVVGGKFNNFELQKFGIDPSILDTRDEKLSDLPDSKGLLEEIFRMEKDVLFEIIEYLKKTPKTKAAEMELRKPMTASLEALIFLFKGFNESDQGNYRMAANYYRRSLKADPGLIPAADSLKELETLGLLGGTTSSSTSITPNADAGTPVLENWRNDYLAALKKGKAVQMPSGRTRSVGHTYTPPEDVTLQEAIYKALETEKRDRVRECVKIAVDLEYNPYLVVKTICEAGGDVEIDLLCFCATEAGVMKAIVAKAAKEAVSILGKPIYPPDEIAKTKCFRGEEGLAYTPGEVSLAAIPIDTQDGKNYVSKSAP